MGLITKSQCRVTVGDEHSGWLWALALDKAWTWVWFDTHQSRSWWDAESRSGVITLALKGRAVGAERADTIHI